MNINKYTSKAMAVMLCMAMALGSSTPSIAAEVSVSGNVAYAGNTVNNAEWDVIESRYEDIEVTYSQGSSYHVTIPKTIALDANRQSSYSVKVEGDIAANKQVCVVPVDGIEETEVLDFYMKDQTEGSAKAAVPAEINQSKFYWNSEEVSASYEETNNHIVAEGLSAGSWKGIFQMEISLRTDTSHIHNYVGTITKEPTCTEAGEKTYTCDCGDSYTEEIPATGHHYTGTITREPTCTEAGEKTYTCDCGDSYTEVIPATGHHYAGGTCTGCGKKDPDHVHSYKESITKEPTCVEDGEKTYTCDCGDSYTEVIPATGKHNYVDGTCTGCGDTEDPYAVAPASAYSDWNYTLNDTDGTITLNYYIGSKVDVTVYSNYEVNGKTYQTKIADNNSNVSSNYMFASKTAVVSVKFGNSIDFSDTTNTNHMFYNCISLTNIDFGDNFDTCNMADMSSMFEGCRKLVTLDITQFDTGNTTNMKRMFSGCQLLKDLDVSSFDTSQVTDMSWMFYSCQQLADLDMGHFDTGNVTDMSNMFNACYGLATIDLSSFKTNNVTDMSSMFANCINLTGLELGGNFDTSNVTTMKSMFYNCSLLTCLDLGGFDTGSVTDMSTMFQASKNLKTIYVSEELWKTSQVTNRKNMFLSCGTSKVTYK